MIRCIIVDDELSAVRALEEELHDFQHLVQVAGVAHTIDEAVALIDATRPDLAFIDIRLKEGSGFDILDRVVFNGFKTVFLTAFDTYAVKAFKYKALDYILKPAGFEDIKRALKRFEELAPAEESNFPSKPSERPRVPIYTSDAIHLLYVDEIIRCESHNNYCEIITRDRKIFTAKTLKEMESTLSPYGFIRIHQSHLVNLGAISMFSSRDGDEILLATGERLPVSRKRKNELFKKINASL